MNRKNFIYYSGAAIAGLVFSDLSYATTENKSLIQLPEKIFITLDDGSHEMNGSNGNLWTYKDVFVKLTYVNGTLQVETGSPSEALHNVKMEWHYSIPRSTSILGDHIERTYGDVSFQPPLFGRKMPWYFIQYNETSTVCFGVKTGCRSICYWQTGDGKMQLTLDIRSGGIGVILGSRVLLAANIIAAKSKRKDSAFITARRFSKMMCDKPILPQQPVYGINDWYITYGANSAEIILNHTSRMAELAGNSENPPFSVIDSGWAYYSPLLPNDCCWQDDFSKPNDHFKDMGLLADNIKKLGMQPGLWTRPLCASHNDGRHLLLPSIPGRDSPKKPVLDPSIEENIERIKNNMKTYVHWGYKLVKHDFTTFDILGKWGNQMLTTDITTPGWRFTDSTRTTAEIILHLYQSIREAAHDIYLLGCNTLSHLSAGIFELNRIGDDTSGREWDRTRKMGVNTLGFRMIHHNHFYSADGDCVGLTTAVPWSKNKQWMQLLAESSTPLFISAQAAAVGDEQKQLIKKSFEQASRIQPIAEPLDWLSNQFPSEWKLNGEKVVFNWNE